ncbi:unnamed protein product [Lupinus luteus]|uniref:CCT domain-containing protein n=1 Tax=Lupinus luteus TaxID=3873 RepID=A0AAV1XNP1_LUPLU
MKKTKAFGRRNRSKTRKPKFLGLNLQLSQLKQNTTVMQQQQQLNLFPLHPENNTVVEEKDMHEENNVALFFSSDGGATLNDLLQDESTTTTTTVTTDTKTITAATTTEEEEGESGSWLVRKAMRRSNKERKVVEDDYGDEGSEERWVCYSEVVEEKRETMEEVSSATVTATVGVNTTSFGVLSLKLDHEGIMNAWSEKGSLYIAEGEAPQTVPDLVNDLHFNNALLPNVPWDGWCSDDVCSTWTVPECCGANSMKVNEEMGLKQRQREESVLRYKEKRQSRLFSKKIRYEVRKLNAEKRPRMKGRFVKRE